MIVAYDLTADDCDRYYFRNAPASIFCPSCRCLVSEDYFPANLKLPRGWDIGCTYDGRHIVSEPFRDACHDLELGGDAHFYPISDDGSTYLLHPKRVIQVDVENARWKREDWCSLCSDFSQTVMPDPFHLALSTPELKYGIYRSDLQIGSHRGKYYLTFVGTETKKQLQNLNFKSMHFHPIDSSSA